MLHWQSQSITDAGKKRRLNEDSLYVDDSQHCWAVADGMGGHHRGDVASQAVVAQLSRYRKRRHAGTAMARIEQLLARANAELVDQAERDNTGICASTVAVLSARANSVCCSWVGDSRIYRFRDGELAPLTRDHCYGSLLADLRDGGVDSPDESADHQALTRGIGAARALQTEHCRYSARAGDRYLICTDGLYKEITEVQLHRLFGEIASNDELIGELHRRYLANGARDNLGMVLLSATER